MGMIDNVKEVVDLARMVNDTRLIKATAELQHECAGYLEQMAKMTRENVALREENATLKQQLSHREEMVFEENVYWRKSGTIREGPFCPSCFDDKGKAVRMQEHRFRYRNDYYQCAVCKCGAEDPHGTPTEDPNEHLQESSWIRARY